MISTRQELKLLQRRIEQYENSNNYAECEFVLNRLRLNEQKLRLELCYRKTKNLDVALAIAGLFCALAGLVVCSQLVANAPLNVGQVQGPPPDRGTPSAPWGTGSRGA